MFPLWEHGKLDSRAMQKLNLTIIVVLVFTGKLIMSYVTRLPYELTLAEHAHSFPID